MVDLTELSRPLVDSPLVPPSPLDHLRARNRRRQRRRALGATGATLVLAASLLVGVLPGSSQPGTFTQISSLASYVREGVAVSDGVLNTVGLPPRVMPLQTTGGSSLTTDNGKPAVIYVGAEYCPYCAVDRWALLVALSRFGTFSNLGQSVSSSSTDVFPDLKSWSYLGSTFSSPSITFDPAEIYSSTPASSPGPSDYQPLQDLTPLQRTAINRYDNSFGSRGLPFIDIGGRYVAVGSETSPSALEGLSLDQIALDLGNPSSPVAQAIDGPANYIVAAICSVAPGAASICSSPFVAQAQSAMAASPLDSRG